MRTVSFFSRTWVTACGMVRLITSWSSISLRLAAEMHHQSRGNAGLWERPNAPDTWELWRPFSALAIQIVKTSFIPYKWCWHKSFFVRLIGKNASIDLHRTINRSVSHVQYSDLNGCHWFVRNNSSVMSVVSCRIDWSPRTVYRHFVYQTVTRVVRETKHDARLSWGSMQTSLLDAQFYFHFGWLSTGPRCGWSQSNEETHQLSEKNPLHPALLDRQDHLYFIFFTVFNIRDSGYFYVHVSRNNGSHSCSLASWRYQQVDRQADLRSWRLYETTFELPLEYLVHHQFVYLDHRNYESPDEKNVLDLVSSFTHFQSIHEPFHDVHATTGFVAVDALR